MTEQRLLVAPAAPNRDAEPSEPTATGPRRSTLKLPEDVRWTDGGVWSSDREYRYALSWAPELPDQPLPVFIGTNPSGASGVAADKTLLWIWQATRGFTMLNLFGFRCTFPWDLLTVADPIGEDNDRLLRERIEAAPWVGVCWGGPPRCPVEAEPDRSLRREKTRRLEAMHAERREHVHALLRELHVQDVRCLGLTDGGYPRHPSRLGYAVPLVPYDLHRNANAVPS